MRTLIVSDVHSNLTALDAVIAQAEANGPVDGVWCLGDIVGYGPWPLETVRRLRSLEAVCIQGNHDAGAIGRISLQTFNSAAREACLWNGAQLDEEAHAYLEGLPDAVAVAGFTLVHGAPRDPLWEYLTGYADAMDALARVDTRDVLVGHTHHQFAFEAGGGASLPGPGGLDVTRDGGRLVVNPGSVGQPRDHDPRAAYAVYDSETGVLSLRRAAYDIAATQRAMEQVGLPEPLISRLSAGR
ncbi:MAG: metallophosphoesterase family protein [Chloroflexota bacterium]|nr:metallophosphoesterase family protein [Chloroflexota bacterium]MDE2885333.1 metallophosphoesterase family protein [Chloroflexota bacterium]